MWTVVYFTEENDSVALIPSSWIHQSRKTCYWPPPPGPSLSLIEKCGPPNKRWKQYPIKVVRDKIVSFINGNELVERARDESELETTDAEAGNADGLSNNSPSNSQSSESEASDIHNPFVPLVTETEYNKLLREQEQERVPSSSIAVISLPTESQHSTDKTQNRPLNRNKTSIEPTSPVTESVNAGINEKLDQLISRQERMEKTVLGAFAEIKQGISQLLVRTANSAAITRSSILTAIPFQFPLTDKTALEDLEKWLSKHEHYELLVKYCCSFGGSDGGKTVRTILLRLFSASLAQQINWIGSNGKVEFRGLKIKSVVIDAARLNVNLAEKDKTDAIIENCIKSWFRNARNLEGGKKQRTHVVVPNTAAENTGGPSSHASVGPSGGDC